MASRRPRAACSALAVGLLLSAGRSHGAPAALRLEPVARGLDRPVHLASPAGDPRLFVVEQPGRIRIVEGGRLLATPFLDLSDRTRAAGERGLLSVAFHPRYARNGLFYVNYTDRRGDTRVERYRAGRDRNRADAASAKLVLFVEQPYSNHNGGHIQFGPDGMLWVGMGDGGSRDDPHGNGQNPRTLLGKLLRLDVDHGDPYAIPADSPFRDGARGRPEIWATGLRNPWRFAFDREADLLYIADVGQDLWEEIHVAPRAAAGLNYGWNVMEGNHPLRRGRGPTSLEEQRRRGLTPAALEYPHEEGCSVTGGHVYRGHRIPGLAGHYFYSDYCRGWIRSFRWRDARATEVREWDLPNVGPVSSFGEDAQGELYVVGHEGGIYRIAPAR